MSNKLFSFFERNYILLLVLLHALWLLQALYFGNFFYPDSYEYIFQSENIVKHQSLYADQWNTPHINFYETLRPPLYALFIILTKGITGSWYVLLICQNILSICNFILLKKIVLMLSSRNGVSFLVFAGLLLFPIHFVHCNTVMTEIVFQSFLLISLYSFIKFYNTKNIKHFFYTCIALTAGVFTKAVLLYAAFPIAGIAIYYAFKNKNYRYVLAGSIMPLFIILQCSYNMQLTGYYHYTSIQMYNRLNHNVREFLVKEKGYAYADSFCNATWKKSFEFKDMKMQYDFVAGKTNAVIKDRLFDYSVFHLKGIFPVLLAPGRDELHFFYGIPENHNAVSLMREASQHGWTTAFKKYFQANHPLYLAAIFMMVTWNIFLLIFVMVSFFNRRIRVEIKVFLLSLIFYIAFASALTVGSARFRIPIYPLMLASAVCGIELPGKRRVKKSITTL